MEWLMILLCRSDVVWISFVILVKCCWFGRIFGFFVVVVLLSVLYEVSGCVEGLIFERICIGDIDVLMFCVVCGVCVVVVFG